MTVIREIKSSLSGSQKTIPPKTENTADNVRRKNGNSNAIKSNKGDRKPGTPQTRSLMKYTIQVDSGKISLPPLIDVKMPMTRFSGERSSLAGFSIESELGKVEFAYGSREPRASQKYCMLLPQIASLPDSLRMHILLCLKDVSPLEIALKVKKENNPFRRIKAVDKAMLKMAKKITKRHSKTSSKKKSSNNHSLVSSRGNGHAADSVILRQRILTEIMKLDDGELTNLWSVHQRYLKKLAKKLREEQDG